MIEHRIDADGVTVVVEEHGETRGPPAVVLHGFSGSAATVAELIAPLVVLGHRVLAPDLVGHGRSDAPADVRRYTMAACVAQLEEACRALDVGPVTVVGYSMGGRLALSWLARQPDRIERLIVIGATPGLARSAERDQRRRRDDELADRIEADGMEWFASFWPEQPIFSGQAARLTDEQRQRLRLAHQVHHPIGLANSLRGMGTGVMPFLPPGLLATLGAPTLAMAGADDEKFCAIGRVLAEQLGTGAFESVPDAGHAAHLEQPDTVGRALARFLGAP